MSKLKELINQLFEYSISSVDQSFLLEEGFEFDKALSSYVFESTVGTQYIHIQASLNGTLIMKCFHIYKDDAPAINNKTIKYKFNRENFRDIYRTMLSDIQRIHDDQQEDLLKEVKVDEVN